jgi:hypothetical protein
VELLDQLEASLGSLRKINRPSGKVISLVRAARDVIGKRKKGTKTEDDHGS